MIKRFIGVGLVGVMSIGLATGVLAVEGDTDVGVTVKGGGLHLDVPTSVEFEDVKIDKDGEFYTSLGEEDITVTDLTGEYHSGWKLSVKASPLVQEDGFIEKDRLFLTPFSVDGKDIKEDHSGEGGLLGEDLQQIVKIGKTSEAEREGRGVNTIKFAEGLLSLYVDPVMEEGDFEATLTWVLETAYDGPEDW